jgi:hypothetical protein
MSLRFIAAALLLLAFAAWKSPGTYGGQNSANPPAAQKWEYKVLKLDSIQCSNESAFNKAGQDGWELVNYSAIAVSFPQDAKGALLIRPSATGPGAANNPPTADSFSGTITIRMSQAHVDACQAVFKRLARPSQAQPQ